MDKLRLSMRNLHNFVYESSILNLDRQYKYNYCEYKALSSITEPRTSIACPCHPSRMVVVYQVDKSQMVSLLSINSQNPINAATKYGRNG
ncbi:MAG: hypothetical protein HW406_1861 [Candidatus Brocadiaceae bacterium]|nr:hypothetical protein [Candidatus Brocadiaceae bacterium]